MGQDQLTDGQRLAVTTLGKPLFIQAGAGTGKTFTLTKRLVYAMSADSGQAQGADAPYLNSIDDFMTITFTRKAAGELVGRMREALRREGLEDASLAVDSSWILTIDAMYRRLLVRCALDTGITDDTVCLDEIEVELYLDEAYERVMARREEEPWFQRLLDIYGHGGLRAYVRHLLNLLLATPDAAAGITFGPAPGLPSLLLRQFSDDMEPFIVDAQEICAGNNKNAAPRKLLDFAEATRQRADELLAASASLDWTELATFAQTLNLAGRSDRSTEELYASFRKTTARFLLECLAGCQHRDARCFCGIAQEVLGEYQAIKERQGVVSLSDFQTKALALLEQDPALAQRYTDAFKLIMVDEFQDTNIAQIRLIQRLTPVGFDTLTTVGDQQQAIYGFRGADVGVFRSMMNKMRAVGAQSAKLDTNFRSHDQILRLVDTVFGQPSVFGDDLVSLKHGRHEDPASLFSAIFAKEPRIRLLMAAGAKGDTKARVGELRQLEARMIAREFAALRARGVKPQDMVLLLGKLTNVGLYRDAFKEQGFDSTITAGSLFFESAEVVTLIELLAALVNPLDSRALVASLLSPVFNLSDDVLLWLAADGEPYQRLREQLDEQAPSSGDPNLAVVARLFERAVCSVGSIQTSQIMRELLSAGGWTALLLEAGEDGIPVLANITKLLRMLDDWEAQHGIDPVGFSCRLRKLQSFLDAGGRVEGLHPGVLQTDDSGAVRIMTIHSSKGLEYPVVAVAEYAGDHIRENETACYRSFDGEQIAVAIKPWPWSLGTNTWGSVVQELLDEIGSSRTSAHEAETALEHFAFLRTASCLAELPERQRLLYVACTRAREALILGLRDSTIAGEPPGLPKKPRAALFGNLETALFPNDGFPHESTAFTFGPSESPITGYYDFEVVGASDEKSETSEGADATADGRVTGFGMVRAIRPQVCEDILAGMQGSFAKPQDIFSYSSLAVRREDDDALTGQKRVWTFKSLTLPKHDDDRDHALRFGLAFHAEARRWIDEGMDERVCDGVDDGGTCSLGDNHGQLAAQDAKRLTEAYCAWVCSKRAASLRTYEKVLTEYPFVVEATDGFILEGRIDVLALDFAKNRALIIDYKTGVSAEGASAALEERYRLQAQCYACAVLKGFETTQSGEATGEEAGEWYTGKMGGRIEEIELAFVRPEVLDAKTGEPEEVVYRFTCNDVPALTAALTSLSAPSSPAADNY